MFELTIQQAVGVWDELFSAYIGKNKFGGDTAEIYIFRLSPYSPTLAHPSSLQREEEERVGGVAARNLCALIDYFLRLHPDAKVTVNDVGYKRLLRKPIYHRVHVRVRAPKERAK